MKNAGWFSRVLNQQPSFAMFLGMLVAMFLAAACIAVAQNPAAPAAEPAAPMSVPAGYSIHESVDLGGRVSGIAGSGAMYDTMVNLHTGPRVLGETFELHALPGTKNAPLDDMRIFASGFGGEPYSFAEMDFSKSKFYEFSGMFRRNRRYFDYNLLGNPNIPSGYSIPIGPSTAPTGYYAWPQMPDSPFMFNTVRHMTDTSLTVLPVSTVTFRFAYSQNLTQGPSLTPSGNAVAGQEVLLQEYQRYSSDDFTFGLDWKPNLGTKLTYEEQIDHYKGDSYFTMDPADFSVQESNGTKVALLDSYQTLVPYGYSSTTGAFNSSTTSSGNCNNSSMANPSTILYANPSGGLPIIDPACNVISSYVRNQATREIFPSEIFRLQSSSIRNLSMDGDVRYTDANMNLPNYYEQFQGLQGANRALAEAGLANAKREVTGADYGIVWQADKTVSLSDQVNFSTVHQPGTSEFTSGTKVTVPTTAGADTINNTNLTTTPATSGAPPDGPSEGSSSIGAPVFGYLGERFLINNATVTWDATPRATLALTYRHGNHVITEGANISAAIPNGTCPSTNPQAYCGTVTVNEDGGILNAALRPNSNWDINGTIEMLYDDNVFTAVAPRQSQHYRMHTLYRPRPWATFSGTFNDWERHNNTNNTGTPPPSYVGPLDHVDHSRFVGLGAALYPNEHYGLDLNYSYSDVYASTNVCFQGAATLMPGGTNVPGAASQSGVLCATISGTHGISILWAGRDFMDAPTQYGSAAVALSPATKLRSDIGYRISSVNGSRFFNNAQDVNGSLVSTYQSPFVNLAYTMHPGLIWKAEYNFYGYGEGGPSGAQYCINNPALSSGAAGSTVPVVPCSSVPNTAMSPGSPVYGFTAPRNFHANNVVLGVHYEF